MKMNRIVLSTVAVLVALVGFAMMGEDQEATAGLFGRKCCKPACCEPEPTCCEPVCGGKHKKCGGLFARMKARKCCKPSCCEPVDCCPEPTCCEAPACEPACGCDNGCKKSCHKRKKHCHRGLLGIFGGCHKKKCCKKSCCQPACESACGCTSGCTNGGAPAPQGDMAPADDAAPMPPAPTADPSASFQGKRRVLNASSKIVRRN